MFKARIVTSMVRPVVKMERIKQTSRVKRRIAEDGVELSIITVDILKAATATAASMPVLGIAADIVSRILNQISQAQQNTELALRIATRCARVLATISEHLDTLENPSAISNSIDRFVTDLCEVQDFIERETNRNMFYLFFFAKRRAGQFQDLQSKVQDAIGSLQITTLMTLYDVVQRYSSVPGQGKLQRTPTDGSEHRTDREFDIIPEKELFVDNGFRLHFAQVNGNNAILKVFEGENAQKNCEETVEFERDLIHPNLLCPKSSHTKGRTPFIVYDRLNVQKTAEQFIAAAIPSGVIPAFIAGARLISGISSALSRLKSYHRDFNSVRIENFSVFMNSANQAVLSFDSSRNSTSESRGEWTGLDILNGLCHKTFNAANEILYRDTLARTSDTSWPLEFPIVNAEDGESNAAPGEPYTAATIDANLSRSRSRREIMWEEINGSSVVLDDISHQFATAVESLSFTLFLLKCVARISWHSDDTVHRCPGYRREEVTLMPVLSECNVITHVTPFLHEKCLICGKDVEEGKFNCKCGTSDDGITPTVKCTKCLVWGHSYCNNQLGCVCSASPSAVATGTTGSGRQGDGENDGSRKEPHALDRARVSRNQKSLNNSVSPSLLSFKEIRVGPPNAPTWTLVMYVGGAEFGRGTARTKSKAKEIAISETLQALLRQQQ